MLGGQLRKDKPVDGIARVGRRGWDGGKFNRFERPVSLIGGGAMVGANRRRRRETVANCRSEGKRLEREQKER